MVVSEKAEARIRVDENVVVPKCDDIYPLISFWNTTLSFGRRLINFLMSVGSAKASVDPVMTTTEGVC